MAVKIDYGLGCPFCEGSPEESTRPVKGGFQTRVMITGLWPKTSNHCSRPKSR